jgi:hypothetical protein
MEVVPVKPVPQLVDSGENGDCFRACVASILELDPNDLPNVGDPAVANGRYHVTVMNEALAKWHLALFLINKHTHWTETPYYIWSIRSPKYEGKTHAVVVAYDEKRDGMGWYVAWDPSPWRDEPGREKFYAKPLAAYLFLALDPRKNRDRYVDEAYAILEEDFLGADKKSPQGFSFKKLAADLKGL